MNVVSLIAGPLVGPECRRALGRGWLILARSLFAAAVGLTVLMAVWYWWINEFFDPQYRPTGELRTGLLVIEGLAVTLALIVTPAVLGGSIAGEKGRGVLALLLTTRASSRDVILGRLTGKLTQVAMILLAGLPALVLMGSLAGLTPVAVASLLALPAGIAFGSGGIAIFASTISRNGRDALLTVYFFDILVLLTPLLAFLGLPPLLAEWIPLLDPFTATLRLTVRDQAGLAEITWAIWLVMGAIGAGLASWRLRPACLAVQGGARPSRARRGTIPPPGDRPMLWKELYIERTGSLGRAGRWLAFAFVVLLGGGSAVVGGIVAWDRWHGASSALGTWAATCLEIFVADPSVFVGWLLEWAVGLRAATTISSERERGTWDALLTSPLSGREIVWGKLWGSLYGLRWCLGASFLAWSVAACCSAMTPHTYGFQVGSALVVGAFIASIGVRFSLRSATAARAMTWTIGTWLAAQFALAIAAGIVLALLMLLWLAVWMILVQAGVTPWGGGPTAPISGSVAWGLLRLALFAVLALLVAGDTSLRFDRIAGRMTGGRVSVALDRLVYGPAMEAVPVGADGRMAEPNASANAPGEPGPQPAEAGGR